MEGTECRMLSKTSLVVMQTQPQDWTDQETLLLLEGLELHKDRWGDIADHVGTKSQVQCILHFLQLPIEDEFLDELDDRGRKSQGVQGPSQHPGGGQEGTAANDLIPFADTGNPILSQVALLITPIARPQVGTPQLCSPAVSCLRLDCASGIYPQITAYHAACLDHVLLLLQI